MRLTSSFPRALGLPVLALLSGLVPAQSHYTVQDLGTFGGELANALGINDAGDVVGQAEAPGFFTHAFVWSDGVMTMIPGLSNGDSGRADGINELGHVVGSSMAPMPGGGGFVGHAFFWSPATGTIDLTPGTSGTSQAVAINDHGQIAGATHGPSGTARRWTVDSQGQVTSVPIALPGAPAGFGNEATDINDAGHVCGVGYNAAFQYRAWKWTGSGDAIELPTLGGVQSIAEGINDAGEICGTAQLPNNLHVPVKWMPDGSIVQLGLLPLPNVFSSEGRAINNLGHVVGAELYIDPSSGLGASAPWVWIDGTKRALADLVDPVDLLEWDLRWAIDINDSGQIVGIAIRTINGVEYHGRAFLLTPPAGSIGTPLCAGDGSGAACPCGNNSTGGAGCANSTGAGAVLAASGSASVAADDLAFGAQGLIRGQSALLFVGNQAAGGGAGTPFGDGLRCAGGGVQRLGVRQANGTGAASWGPNLSGAGAWAAGDTRVFQVWYRDPLASVCGAGFNLTQGLELSFLP